MSLLFWCVGGALILFGIGSIVNKPPRRRGIAVVSGIFLVLAGVLGIGFDSWWPILFGCLGSFLTIGVAGSPYDTRK